VFPDLIYAGQREGRPVYTDSGIDNGGVIPDGYALFSSSEGEDVFWYLANPNISVVFESSEDVESPDLVTTWTPESPATGTPTVTARAATAAQTIAAINAASALYTAANGPGSNGTGAIAAATAVFSGGG
jgi:hypothetical protein